MTNASLADRVHSEGGVLAAIKNGTKSEDVSDEIFKGHWSKVEKALESVRPNIEYLESKLYRILCAYDGAR